MPAAKPRISALGRRLLSRVEHEVIPVEDNARMLEYVVPTIIRDIFDERLAATAKDILAWSRTPRGAAQAALIYELIATANWVDVKTVKDELTPEEKAATERFLEYVRHLAAILRSEVEA